MDKYRTTELFFISFGPLSPCTKTSVARRSCPLSRNPSKVLARMSTVLLLPAESPGKDNATKRSWPWAIAAVAVSFGAIKRLNSLHVGNDLAARHICQTSQMSTIVDGEVHPENDLAIFRECHYPSRSFNCICLATVHFANFPTINLYLTQMLHLTWAESERSLRKSPKLSSQTYTGYKRRKQNTKKQQTKSATLVANQKAKNWTEQNNL